MIPAVNLHVLMLGFLLSTFQVSVSAQTLAERLGYPPRTKLIIVHADDLGETHAVNAAAIKALQGGTINSASLMVACPWFPEIADYAKSGVDFISVGALTHSAPAVDLSMKITAATF